MWTVRVAQRSVVQYLRVIRSQQEALSRLWTRVDNDRVLVAARMRHNEAIKKSEEVDALMRASNAGGSVPQREPIASRRKCVAVCLPTCRCTVTTRVGVRACSRRAGYSQGP